MLCVDKQVCVHKGQVQEVEAIRRTILTHESHKVNHFHLDERLCSFLSFLDLGQRSEVLLLVSCGPD